jgi:hypothetical protein
MSGPTTDVAILATLIFVISIVVHWRFRSIVLPSLTAALLVAAAFLLIDTTAHLGYLDPFDPLAFTIVFLWAAAAAFLIDISRPNQVRTFLFRAKSRSNIDQ